MLTADIPGLKIERADDENGESLITLEQDDGCGNIESVVLHPIHVRYLAERMGLLDMADQQSQKTIVALKRRLETLFDRIGFLHNYLCNHSDSQHADLTFEQTYATATLDIAHEFMLESGIDPVSVTADGTESPSANRETAGKQ